MFREEIYKLIDAERDRQNEKFGPQKHLLAEWITILTEEVGELAKECLEIKFQGKTDVQDYISEAIQVAAVIVAMLESWHDR